MRNRFEIRGPVTAIFIGRRGAPAVEFLIDTDDLPKVQQHTWRRNGAGYAYTITPPTTAMSRIIMGTPRGLDCDHSNHDFTDNRKTNLRNVSRSLNCRNRKTCKNIFFEDGKWVVYFTVNYRRIVLARTADKDAAARIATDARAKALAGEPIEAPPRRKTSCGIRGIYRFKDKFRANYWNGKNMGWLGDFDTIEEAKGALQRHHERYAEKQAA